MQLFYCPDIFKHGGSLIEEDAKHCFRVLRKKTGDHINITDGKGSFYVAQLTDISSHECHFEIVQSVQYDLPPYLIHIAIAPTKNIDRTEWFVEKATEIGVSEISFIVSAHSERNKINLDRIQKKAISAMKQSIRPYLPKIHDIDSVNIFTKRCDEDHRYVAHLDEKSTPFLSSAAPKAGRYVVMIGPEGGFSKDEITLFYQSGFQPVKLGDNRLRTETAGIMACAILNTINLQ